MENPKKVLIIKEQDSIQEEIEAILSGEGFAVTRAFNGQDGLEKFEAEQPDLIISDVAMPVMDGWAMMEKLRQRDDYAKNMPVIMFSDLSASDEEVVKKVAEIKPMHYIVKSETPIKEVVVRVKELLS